MRSEIRNALVKAALTTEMRAAALQTPDDNFAWPWPEIPEIIRHTARNGIAVLGGEICAVENGEFIETIFDGGFLKLWDTKPSTAGESWDEYCHRTVDESLRELSDFAERSGVGKSIPIESFYLAPTFALRDDPRHFVPRDKHDHLRAEAAVGAGYPAIEPVIGELLEWMQDCNWPVAGTLEPLFAGIGRPLAPHLRRILQSNDPIWKYWIISRLISESRDLCIDLKDELSRIATAPTESERQEGVDVQAKEVLSGYGLLDTK